MQYKVRIHYDNKRDFRDPRLWIWVSDGATLKKKSLPPAEISSVYIMM